MIIEIDRDILALLIVAIGAVCFIIGYISGTYDE